MARYVEPRCPLRPADRCSLCQPGADGPHNCGLVYLVMSDDQLRDAYSQGRARERSARSGA